MQFPYSRKGKELRRRYLMSSGETPPETAAWVKWRNTVFCHDDQHTFLNADSLKKLNAQFQTLWDFKCNAPVGANIQKCASLDYQIIGSQMSRKLSCLTSQLLLSVSHTCTTQDFHGWDGSPFTAGGSSDLMDVPFDFLLSPHAHYQTDFCYCSIWISHIRILDLCFLYVI